MTEPLCEYTDSYAVLHAMPLGVCIFDADYTVRFWNRCLESWTKIPAADIVGKNLRERFPHLREPRFTSRFDLLFQGGPPVIFSARLHGSIIPSSLPGGIFRLQHTVAQVLKDTPSGRASILMTMQDVTEAHVRLKDYSLMHDKALHEIEMRRKTEAILRESEERFSSAFEYAANGMALVGLDGQCLKANQALCQMLGYVEAELLAMRVQELTHPGDVALERDKREELLRNNIHSFQVEKRFLTKSADVIWVLLSISLVRDGQGGPMYFITQIENITTRKRLEQELRILATTDSLTGISNRRAFLERVEKDLLRCQRQGLALAFLMIDIDHFKTINDTWGHGAGDAVLKAMSGVCQQTLRATDLIGRLGGEEFGIMLVNVDRQEVLRVTERLRLKLAEHDVMTEYATIRFTVSIGVAHYDGGFASIELLMKQADAALYEAKTLGRDRICLAPASSEQCPWPHDG